jgi:hypothetical protein
MFLGISLNPKPRRKAPVTSPKVFEHAIAKPTIPPSLSKIIIQGLTVKRVAELFKKVGRP